MGEPDALSRRADLGPSGRDNQGIVLLDPSVFRIHALQADLVCGTEQDIVREIRESLETGGTTEEPVARAARALREDRARGQVRCSEWSEGEGLLMFGGCIYVPYDKDLQHRIMSLYLGEWAMALPGSIRILVCN